MLATSAGIWVRLSSFKPVADRRSRVLILGTLPGPTALRRRQYYGFPGNHFWPILQELFGVPGRPLPYPRKIRLLKENGVALWDVIARCRRPGASDSAITGVTPNRIPELLRKYPNIRAVFVNGKTAERLFRLHFEERVRIPIIGLPSTSPAHASMSFRQKLRRWRRVKKEL